MGLREAFDRMFGGWLGDVWPTRGPEPLPPKDARQHALDAFADFVADLTFQLPEATRTFNVERKNVFTHMPPDPSLLKFPSIAFAPARGRHDQYSLGPSDEVEGTVDAFAPGTVLLNLGEYSEQFTVETWSTHDPMRTAILAGIVAAIRLGQWSNALLLRLPEYYGLVARISLEDSEHIDDPDVVRGRVRGHLYLRLEVPEVQLVDAVTFKPYLRLQGLP